MEMVEEPLRYSEYQARGKKILEWVNNPSASGCFIEACNVTWNELNDWASVGEAQTDPNSIEHREIVTDAQQRKVKGPWTLNDISSREVSPGGTAGKWDLWESFIAPGNLYITNMFRESGYHASQIAQVLYERQHPIRTLKHVIVIDVVNEDTIQFCEDELFTANNGLVWPPPRPQTFVYGSAEYEGLVGTRLGTTVTYLVLGAFARGTHRISQITVEHPYRACIMIRFDIEDLNSISSPSSKGSSPGSKRRQTSDDDEEYVEGPRKRRKSPGNTDPEHYSGPARRTRKAVGGYTVLPEGRIRKPPY